MSQHTVSASVVGGALSVVVVDPLAVGDYSVAPTPTWNTTAWPSALGSGTFTLAFGTAPLADAAVTCLVTLAGAVAESGEVAAAAPGRLTKFDIVARALEIVGISRLQTRGELWADMLLNHLAHTARFPELAATHSALIGSGTSAVAYPGNYAFLLRDATKGHVGSLTDSSGTKANLWLYDGAEVQGSLQRTTAGAGTPFGIADDRANSRWLLLPISNIAATLSLHYQKAPAVTGSNDTVWWPDDLALMEAIIAIAERHQRGGLVTVQQAVAEQARAMVMRAPGRAQLWTTGGPGANLDSRFFRK